MTQARKAQVSLEETPFYHCYVCCVRRAFLCGEDHQSGDNYDHRKQLSVGANKGDQMSTEWVANTAEEMSRSSNQATAKMGQDIYNTMKNNPAKVERLGYEANANGVDAKKIKVPN